MRISLGLHVTLLVIITVLLVGLTPSSQIYSPAIAQSTASHGKVALVMVGSIDDIGWGTSHYKGLLALKDMLGFEIAFSESVPPPEWENAIRGYAERGYTYVIMAGAEFTDVAKNIAPDYPETMFLVTVAAPPTSDDPYPKNLVGIDPTNEQSGYLAGVLAAGMTKTNKVGIVAGVDYPNVIRWTEGFKLGAITQNPDVTIFGIFAGSWNDVAKGYEAARGQIDNGADVIWQYLNQGTVGVVTAIKESPGVWLIGNINDQVSLAPNVTLTSALINYTGIVLEGIKGLDSRTITGGEFYRWGIKEGVVGLAPYHETESKIPVELKAKVEDLEKQMINGTFVVPEIYENDGYKKYTHSNSNFLQLF